MRLNVGPSAYIQGEVQANLESQDVRLSVNELGKAIKQNKRGTSRRIFSLIKGFYHLARDGILTEQMKLHKCRVGFCRRRNQHIRCPDRLRANRQHNSVRSI